VDRRLAFRLEPASPPSVEVDGEIRYGRSDAVPSRLDEPPTGVATVVVLASPNANETGRSLAALSAAQPAGVHVVVVADGVEPPTTDASQEVVRTSAPLGRGAALNIGIRRAAASVVVVLDPSIVPVGDVITPLGVPRLTVLNALLMFAKTFRLDALFLLCPIRNALEILKPTPRYVGPILLRRRIPGGRSLITPSPLSSLPVVML